MLLKLIQLYDTLQATFKFFFSFFYFFKNSFSVSGWLIGYVSADLIIASPFFVLTCLHCYVCGFKGCSVN